MVVFISLNNFRQLVKHIFQTYVPTFIIVFVSWLSFLVPPAAYPGRMGMLVVLLLVIINILLKVVEMSPRPSGICGLTLWTIICLITVSQYVSMKFLIESIILVSSTWFDRLQYSFYILDNIDPARICTNSFVYAV